MDDLLSLGSWVNILANIGIDVETYPDEEKDGSKADNSALESAYFAHSKVCVMVYKRKIVIFSEFIVYLTNSWSWLQHHVADLFVG